MRKFRIQVILTAPTYSSYNDFQSTAASGKLIPRLVDATGSVGEPGELIPAEWNVFDVAQFLRVNDCAAYCDSFSRRVSEYLFNGREICLLDLSCACMS